MQTIFPGRAMGAPMRSPSASTIGRAPLERLADARHAPGGEESAVDLGLSDVA
jgi:hypothetical protein